ncbi:MAG TPA: carboxypeptidase regulatory-like domain-containing protein, partial [Pyrinomonadaceae bacterium]|nr:carboxypeptidase regulatory-like domain-containing protein [Pyrinomonadaceae bacterium]
LAPLAANVSISGRVTANGVSVRNAVVRLTTATGTTRTVRTSAFGYYRFDDVEVGETYVVSVNHKRYLFASQVVSVTEDLTELNFTAEP